MKDINEEKIIFGSLEKFAIEILPNVRDKSKGKLKLWLNNYPVGNLERKAEYIHGIQNLKKYFTSKDILYASIFDNLNESNGEELIDEWMELGNSIDKKGWDEFDKRKRFIRFFGDQLDGAASIFSFYKDNIVTWIIWEYKKKKKPIKIFKINDDVIDDTFNNYINWYENQFGFVSFNPNQFP